MLGGGRKGGKGRWQGKGGGASVDGMGDLLVASAQRGKWREFRRQDRRTNQDRPGEAINTYLPVERCLLMLSAEAGIG